MTDSDNPLVTTVIPTYNYARFVRRAIESALNQTYSPMEIIVVDDGSTDNTRKILKPYMDKITYIYQENAGLPAARNTGIKAGHGEWFAFLDADDEWLPEKTEKQMQLAARNPKLGMIYGSTYIVENSGKIVGFSDVAKWEGQILDVLYRYNVIQVPTVLISRKALEEVGGYDESLVKGCEDWDINIRIAARFPIGCVKDYVSRYTVHSEQMSSKAGKMMDAMKTVIRKNSNLFPPEEREWRMRESMAFAHVHIARILVSSGKRLKGMEHLLQAVKTWPGIWRNHRYVYAWFMGIFGVSLANKFRQKLFLMGSS